MLAADGCWEEEAKSCQARVLRGAAKLLSRPRLRRSDGLFLHNEPRSSALLIPIYHISLSINGLGHDLACSLKVHCRWYDTPNHEMRRFARLGG